MTRRRFARSRRGGGVRATRGEAVTTDLGWRVACRAALPVRAVVGCGGRLGGAVLGGTPRRFRSSSAWAELAALQRDPLCLSVARWRSNLPVKRHSNNVADRMLRGRSRGWWSTTRVKIQPWSDEDFCARFLADPARIAELVVVVRRLSGLETKERPVLLHERSV